MKLKKRMKLMEKLCDKAERHNMILGFGSINKEGLAEITLEATENYRLVYLSEFVEDVGRRWEVNPRITSEYTDCGYKLFRLKLQRIKK